jgi:hypothetical protein
MTLDTERQSFRGVVCLHCKAPIPVPAIVRNIQETLLKEAGASRENSSVFNVRCPSCHKEKPYRIREIVDFEGAPQPMTPFAQPNSVRPFQLGGATRAAKA